MGLLCKTAVSKSCREKTISAVGMKPDLARVFQDSCVLKSKKKKGEKETMFLKFPMLSHKIPSHYNLNPLLLQTTEKSLVGRPISLDALRGGAKWRFKYFCQPSCNAQYLVYTITTCLFQPNNKFGKFHSPFSVLHFFSLLSTLFSFLYDNTTFDKQNT